MLGTGEGDGIDFVILRWKPTGNRPERTEAIPAGDIGNREGWARLSNRGLRVTAKPQLRAILADHLTDSDTGELWNVATLSGWQHGVYIMPDGEIIGGSDKRVVFMVEVRRHPVTPYRVPRKAGANPWPRWWKAMIP